MTMLTLENINIYDHAEDWRDALQKAVQPLIDHGYVEKRYLEGIIENTQKHGPYYVLAPEIALPHARPDQGVIKKQLGVTLLRKPVKFSEDGFDVRILITLAATDNESHLETLKQLSEILMDDDRVRRILEARTKDEILELFTY